MRISAQDAQRFEQEFGRWFDIHVNPTVGTVKLALKHDPSVTREQIRFPGEPLEQFIDRFLAFAWRTLWSLT